MSLLLMRIVTSARGRRGLVPASVDAQMELHKLPNEGRVWVKIDRSRSLQQHRLFWSVLQHVAQATEYEAADKLLVALKLRLGLVDLVKIPGRDQPVEAPKSISFAAMKQDGFNEFFKQSMEVICSEILGGYDSTQLLEEVTQMIEPARAG